MADSGKNFMVIVGLFLGCSRDDEEHRVGSILSLDFADEARLM